MSTILRRSSAASDSSLNPASTSSAPLPFERLITGMALDARVNKEAPKTLDQPLVLQ